MATEDATDWIDRFEGLAALAPPQRALLAARGTVVRMPAGTVVFGPGKRAENMLLLLKGRVRVQQVSESGREIVLYRVHAGESCVMTTASLLSEDEMNAEGIAETDIEAVAIPRSVFDDLLARSPTFRRFVFAAYGRRLTDLFLLIEDVAFQRMDIRLAQRLIALAGEDGTVRATHQQIASELGSAREVVTRLLQEFQRRGWLTLSRGSIEIADRAALEGLAAA